MNYIYQRLSNKEVEEAVILWRLGPPTTKINTKRATRLRDRYKSATAALSYLQDPYHDVIATELRAFIDCLQEIIERRLQREEYGHIRY